MNGSRSVSKRKDFAPFNFMDSGFNERKLGRKNSFFICLSFCEDNEEKKERKREESQDNEKGSWEAWAVTSGMRENGRWNFQGLLLPFLLLRLSKRCKEKMKGRKIVPDEKWNNYISFLLQFIFFFLSFSLPHFSLYFSLDIHSSMLPIISYSNEGEI